MNVAAHRSSPATVRPAVLLGLAVFMFVLTLQEISVGRSFWLWVGNAKLLVLASVIFGARYAGRRLSVRTASILLALTVIGSLLFLR